MSENTNTQKVCPACGRPNKSHDNYCISCGFSLSGDPSKDEIPDPTKTKKNGLKLIFGGLVYFVAFFYLTLFRTNTGVYIVLQYLFFLLALILLVYGIYRLRNAKSYIISVPPIEIKDEPNKTEITETLSRVRKRLLYFLVLPLIGLFMVFPIVFRTFQAMLVPIFIAPLLLGLWAIKTRGWKKLRTFSISDNYIRINTPKRPPLLIRWADFDTIQMYIENGDEYNPHIYLHMKFYHGQDLYLSYMIEKASDFRSSTTKKIRTLIEQYAIRQNKQVISKKKIKGRLLEKKANMH